MHAARIIGPSPETGHETVVGAPEIGADDAVALRIASAGDAATASPVHAMQAQLARSLRRRPVRGLDPVRVAFAMVALVYTVGAWLGVVSLGSVLVHYWAGH